MNKETFKAQLTTLCASALASGVIDLDRFNALMQFSSPVTAQKPTVTKKKNTWTTNQWKPEMFKLITGLHLQGWTNKSIAREMNKSLGANVSEKAVQTMIWKICSGRVFEFSKYNKEPFKSVIEECHLRLRQSESTLLSV